MNKLLALADRVEKLTGPDREVDVRISLALSGVSYSDTDVADLLTVRDEPTGYGRYRPADEYVPAYTTSLDAAMTLVPERWGWQLSQTGVAGAWLISDGQQPITVGGITFPGVTAQVRAENTSPALALTCAALRARAHGGGDG